MSHAILSPSAASRWLKCTPSARFEQQFENKESEVAAEGTLAHKLAEVLLKKETGQYKLNGSNPRANNKQFKKDLLDVQSDPLYSKSMLEHVEQYVAWVMEQYNTALIKNASTTFFLEDVVEIPGVPEGFGTVDVRICNSNYLHIIDFKYGKGVEVRAANNRQLMCYAIGALAAQPYAKIATIETTIYQPRLNNIDSFIYDAGVLGLWAKEVLEPQALLAFAGEGAFEPGEHCRFCRAKGACKANAAFQLEIAKYEFKDADRLTLDEITDILNRLEQFKSWGEAVRSYALDEALKGAKIPDYKLVQGKSSRKITDEFAAADALIDAGTPMLDVWDLSLRTITALEKQHGKQGLDDLIGAYISKSNGAPTLAHVTDKRAEIGSAAAAAADFAGIDTAE